MMEASRPRSIRRRAIGAVLLGIVLANTLPASLAHSAERVIPRLKGHVTAVIDGNTLTVQLASGPVRLRLQSIDAPERDQAGGDEATATLRKLVVGRDVEVEITDQSAGRDRFVGIVYLGDVEINEVMVRQGEAWADRRHMRRKDDAILCIYEEEARGLQRGFWALAVAERVPPWEWRQRKTRTSFTDYTDETAANCLAAVGSH